MAFALSTVLGISTYYGDIKTTYVHGLEDIRLGIDIQGGVDITFEPENDMNATEDQMDAALQVINMRLVSLNINDSETSNECIIHRPRYRV